AEGRARGAPPERGGAVAGVAQGTGRPAFRRRRQGRSPGHEGEEETAMGVKGFSKDLLKGKVAVVTGGGTGIGRVIARDLAARGAKVALLSRNLERLQSAAKEIPGAAAFACDVADARQVKEAALAV